MNRLRLCAIHFRLSSSLFHEVSDLWDCVFELRFVLDICGGVVKTE